MRQPLDSSALGVASLCPPGRWREVDVLDEVDSTNSEALRGPRPWRVVVADAQTAGRGRLLREWTAPPCASVAVSAVVPMSSSPPGWLPLLAGMAVSLAIARVTGAEPRLKWPNDVLLQANPRVDGEQPHRTRWLGAARKVAGVLCEVVPPGELVVVGVGVNIDQGEQELPVPGATSLALCGFHGVRRERLVAAYLEDLAVLHSRWAEGGAALAALQRDYRGQCQSIGAPLEVLLPSGDVERGRGLDVDDAGRLVTDSGCGPTAHAAGDVVHASREQPA